MSRFDEIAKIYDHKLTTLRDPKNWEETLRRISSFWRLNFCESMLLTEQNPKAVMCGTLAQWNKIGRYIRQGEKSTAIFSSRSNTELMYLFDVSQTYGIAYNAKWKMSERMADGIVGKYNAENAENAVSFEDFLEKRLDKNINIVYNYDSKLTKAMEIDPHIAFFIRQSAACICMTRCGINAEFDFSAAAKLASDLSIVEIGNAANALAQEVMRDIDRTIRRKEYEHYEAGVCGRHLRYTLRGRSEQTSESEVQELRQEGHDAAGAQGSRSDERNGSDGARSDKHEWTVSADMERNRAESGERKESHDTNTDEESKSQSDLYGERTAEDGNRYGGSGSSLGIDPDERGMVGGGSQEPWAADEDQGYSSEYDDEELIEEDEMASDESDAISVFTDIPEEISPDSDYAQKLLEDEIIHGSGYYNGKFRISEFIAENAPANDELAKFLKKEYGIGGSSRNNDPVGFCNHDNKGIELVLNTEERKVIRYSWAKVAAAVRKAVDNGSYITDSDIESRRRIAINDAQRFKIHYEFPNCLDNSRLQYFRKEITDCGLDTQIQLNAEMFAVYAAECLRTKEHIKESYLKIDRSSLDIPWKYEWNEAAEAGSKLSEGTGYERFRAMCRDSVSELMTEISKHTGSNPSLGFTDEEITKFFSSGEPLADNSIDRIAADVFGYLYNREQHDKLNQSKKAVFQAAEQSAEQFTLFGDGDNEFGIEEPQEEEKLSDEEKSVHHGEAVDSDSEETVVPASFAQDIAEHKLIRISEKEKDDSAYPVENKSDLKLSNFRLSFSNESNSYVLIADSEKAGADVYINQFLQTDGASEIYAYLNERDMQPLHEETEVSHRDAPTSQDTIDRNFIFQKVPATRNYRFSEDFSYPTGAKAKYTANVTAIKVLKQIESEHRHATAEEQDILAHYSGWGGIADAFDSSKENWSREYAELKDLLTDKEYAAARESTLTAFYTEPYIINR